MDEHGMRTTGGGAFPDATPGATRVAVTIPADVGRLSVLRSLAAVLAMSLDFDIDTVADLRMAVDELGATAVTRARTGSEVQFEFVADAASDTVSAHARAEVSDSTPVDEHSFGWMVLTTLTESVSGDIETRDGAPPSMRLSLTVRAVRDGR